MRNCIALLWCHQRQNIKKRRNTEKVIESVEWTSQWGQGIARIILVRGASSIKGYVYKMKEKNEIEILQ